MKWAATLTGSVAAIGLFAGLPLVLGSLPPPIDLEAHLPWGQSFQIVDQPGLTSASPPVIRPAPGQRGVSVSDMPPEGIPGLSLRTWQVSYGHRWDREVTLPILTGPFEREGSESCGLIARLGAGLFDTSGAGAGLEDAIHKKFSELFPRTLGEAGVQIAFPGVRETDLQITLRAGLAEIAARITLLDGTVFSARFPARLVNYDGSPSIERAGPVLSSWTGPTRDQARRAGAAAGESFGAGLGALGGFLLGGPEGASIGGGIGGEIGSELGAAEANRVAAARSQQEITSQIDRALAHLTLGLSALRKPIAPFPSRPMDSIRLRLAANPAVSPHGITLPLCASVHVGGSKVNASVSGPAHVIKTAPPALSDPADEDDAAIELAIDTNGLNQALYFAWQSGFLREIGRSSAILDAMPATVRNLAFDVTGFDPGLPPTITTALLDESGSRVPVILGDIAIGTWGPRRVTGHATALLELTSSGDDVAISSTLKDIHVNCVEAAANDGVRLSPCLSDLLPTVRETMEEKPMTRRMPGADLLGRLPREPFKGMEIDWSGLRVNVRTEPPALYIRVDAKARP
jgi:hypothetical protein